jgi:hypothetical protein
MPPALAADFSLVPCKKISTAYSMRYREISKRSLAHALDAWWIFAALPRVRARLAELRAARSATLHHRPSSANSRTTREAAPAREAFTAGGRVRIRAVFISASEDEP